MVRPLPKEVTSRPRTRSHASRSHDEVFRPGNNSNAPRIPDETWEKWRPEIVEIFKRRTLAEAMEYMAREHNFSPTKRQYVHRLRGWGVKKYKQSTTSESPNPNLAPALNGRGPRLDTASAEEPGSGRDAVPCSLAAQAIIQELPVENVVASVLLQPMVATQTPIMREPPYWAPRLNSTDDKVHYLGLADMLVVLRDSHYAFVINAALWIDAPSNAYTVTCVATAQLPPHVEVAKRMAEADAAALSIDERSWTTRFVDLLRAHTFDWGADEANGLAQVDDAVQDIVGNHEGRDWLVDLTPRGLQLDVQAYILLRWALVRYNRPDGEDKIDVHDVLDQFIAQHLAAERVSEQRDTNPILAISCIRSCLTWCLAMLARNPDIPAELRGIDGNTATETFSVLCTLWRLCQRHGLPSSSPSYHTEPSHSNTTPSLDWANDAEPQLGLRPTQLLSTMVCMIMAAAPQHTPVLARALAGANALSTLDILGPEGLLHRFLHQACTGNRRLVAQPQEERGYPVQSIGVDARMIEPFRQFAAGSLGIYDLPVLEEEAVLCDFVLAG